MNKTSLIFLIFFTFSCSGHWSYEEKNSPKNWGRLSDKFRLCKIGYNQSPIDVKGSFKSEDLSLFHSDSEATKVRSNYVMRLNFYDKNHLTLAKRKYFLRYLEFHHPSEHLVASEPYSLEMQIYYKSENEQHLALAIFLEIGEENPNFKPLIDLLVSKKKEGKIDLSKIIKLNDKMFFYDGSYTTPPCEEGLKWYVLQTPLKISKEQMNKIIKLAIFTKSNSRPVQEFHPERF